METTVRARLIKSDIEEIEKLNVSMSKFIKMAEKNFFDNNINKVDIETNLTFKELMDREDSDMYEYKGVSYQIVEKEAILIRMKKRGYKYVNRYLGDAVFYSLNK